MDMRGRKKLEGGRRTNMAANEFLLAYHWYEALESNGADTFLQNVYLENLNVSHEMLRAELLPSHQGKKKQL